MKKTNFTFARKTGISARQRSLAEMRCIVSLLMFLLFGSIAFGQAIMDPCPVGSGNTVNNCPAPGPYPLVADANCEIVVPDYTGGVSGTAGAGYQYGGAIQVPPPGAIMTLSNIPAAGTNIPVQVAATFVNLGPPFGPADPMDGLVCAENCAPLTINVTDNTQPTVSCANATVSAGPTCSFTLTDAYVRANLISSATDNCTGNLADMTLVYNPGPYAPNPAVCAANTPFSPPNPQPPATQHPITIQVQDAAGNLSLSCSAQLTVVDDIPPDVTFGDFTSAPAGGTFAGKSMTINADPGLCTGTIPDLTAHATITVNGDNCQPAPPFTIVQSPAAGSMFNASCPGTPINVVITVYDCWKNTTQQNYSVTIADLQAPTIGSSCASIAADPGFPALPLVADATCSVTIPDLTGLVLTSDNCPLLGPVTVVQQPPAGPLDVSGMCPPNTGIQVRFIATDACNNADTLTCADLLTFTDNTPPMVVCPATPIPVVVPFDGTTCQINMTAATLADAIAGGVTITDACDPNPMLTEVISQMFTCSDIGKAGLTIDVIGQDCFMNADTSTCAVDIQPDVDLTAAWSIAGGDFVVCPTADFPVCIELGPNTPTCGVWSGDVPVTVSATCASGYELVAASFPDLDNDGVPDAGSYSITYTVGPVGCHAEITHNIMISPQFNPADAALVADFSICLDSTEVFDLEGLLLPGSVDGGAFTTSVLSGAVTGTQTGSLWQYTGGDGVLRVIYTLTDCDNSVEADTVDITIDEKPDGHFSMADDMCQDEGVEIPTITGVPSGADDIVFSSSPAGFIIEVNPGDYRFDPAAGPLNGEFVDVLVTMTVSNGVCSNFVITETVRVYESGDPAFVLQDTVCETSNPLTLSLTNPDNDQAMNTTNLVTADNVTWTGTSVTDNGSTGSFDPSVGPGIYTVCATVGAPSCEEIYCEDIVVTKDYTADDVALINDFSLCMFPDDIIDFHSLLAPPVWSGNVAVSFGAQTGGVFDVAVGSGTINGTDNGNSYTYNGGCGTLVIDYYFPQDCDPVGGPPTSDQITITIEEKPDIGGFSVPGPMCFGDAPINIDYSGTPEVCGNPGVFSGNGITDLGTGTTAMFDPSAAGEGVHMIQYQIGNQATGCFQLLTFEVTVNASADTDFTLQSEVCANEVLNLALDNPNSSVGTTASGTAPTADGAAEVQWFGGDGLNAIVTDNGDGTGTFVGYKSGVYTVCVQTGDLGCTQFECQEITVDMTPPVLDCAATVRTRSNDAGNCSYAAQMTEFDVTATDNCVPPNGANSLVLTHDYAPHIGINANSLANAVFPVGITQVVWTATDTAGNAASCTIEIVINDTEDPTVQSCPTSFSQGTDADICGAEITYTIPQFADNCDGPNLEGILVNGYAPGTDFPVGVTTVTWEYTDLADNMTATCSFTVTVNDDDDPTPICVTPIEVSLDEDGSYQLLVSEVDNGSYDNCQVTLMEISRDGGTTYGSSVMFDCADQGQTITVTLRAEDAATNDSTCTTQVTVVDEQVPDIECSPNIVVSNNQGQCSAVVTYPAPTVTDNCPTTVTQMANWGGPADGAQEVPAVTSTGVGTVSATVNSANELNLAVSFSKLGSNVVAAHIHNAAAGSNGGVIINLVPLGFPTGTTSGDFNTTIQLTAAQVTELQAENLYVNIHTVNVPSGEIRGQLLSQGTLTSGDTFPVGVTVQTYEVMDAAGNTESCSFTITVNDEEAPVMDCAPLTRTNSNDAGECEFTMTGTGYDVTATDNCPGVVLTHDYAPHVGTNPNSLMGATFPVGITQVIWTATDCYGNTSSCTVEIIITDDEAATVQSCPTSFSQGTDADICGAEIDYTIPQFADNCDGPNLEGVLVSGYAPGTDFPVGVTTVTWEYTDLADNATATCTFTVTVTDDDNPTPVCSPAYAVSLDGDGEFDVLATDVDNGSYDNCTVVSTLISRDGGTTYAGSVTMTCADVLNSPITVTLKVEDAAGNDATCTTDITVNDDQDPDIECTGNITVVADPTTCSAVVTYPAPTVFDNCTTTVTQIDNSGLTSGDAFMVGTTVQTYQAEDIAGNIDTCSFTIYVYDEVAPTIDCGPTVRTQSADADVCSFTMPGAGFDAVGADNCPGVTITHNYPTAVDPNTLAGSTFPVGTTLVTWIATDASGNQSDICGIEIVITDDQAPTIECIDPMAVAPNVLLNGSFEGGGPFASPGADNWIPFSGGGSPPPLRRFQSADPANFFTPDGSEVLLDLFVSGDPGAFTGLFQEVAVEGGDVLNASIKVRNASLPPGAGANQPIQLRLEFLGNPSVQEEVIVANISNNDWVEVSLSGVLVPAGVNSVRFVIASIPNGTSGSIFVDDAFLSITPPSAVDILVNGSFEDGGPAGTPGADGWIPFAGGGGNLPTRRFASDDPVNFFTPDGSNVSLDLNVPGGVGPFSGLVQEVPVAEGNILNASVQVRNASLPPGAGSLQPVELRIEFPGTPNPPVQVNPIVANISNNDWVEVSLPAVVVPAGVTTINFVIATIPNGGTPGTIFIDDASLTITDLGSTVNFTTDEGECTYKVTDNSLDPTFSDNCANPTLTHNYTMAPNSNTLNGAEFPVGTTSIGFTVTDAAGNTAECTITVAVEDDEDPAFTNCPTTMVMIGNDPDECSGKVNWSIPVATDNCGIQSIVQTGGPLNGEVKDVGAPMTVTYTATDVNGNTSICEFEVQVIDTQDPEFDADIVMPGDITVECDAIPAPFVLTNNDVNDNCTASADLVINFTETDTKGTDPNDCGFYEYTITRTWTVTDEAGNVTTHVQTITVEDNTAPEPMCQSTTITLDLFGNASINPVDLIAGTTDNCADISVLSVTASQTDFDCDDVGDNTVILTISDPCGNTTTCTITVTVVEGAAPCTPEYDVAGSDPCVCLDNATTLENGQFSELFQIKTLAGQTWTVASSTNLYSTASAAPPATPIALPNGTAFTNGGVDGLDNDNDGLVDGADPDEIIYYTLGAKTVDGKQVTATFQNGLGGSILFTNTCYYPTPVFTNLDDPFCIGTPAFVPEVSDLYAGPNAYVSVSFEVDGVPVTQLDPSTLSPGTHTIKVTVDAGEAANSRYINGVLVQGDSATAAAARLNPGCVQMYSEFFQVVTTPSQVQCNDEINVTLEPDCESVITQDMVLEGTFQCFDDYTVELYLPGGVPLNPSNVVTGAHVGQALDYILVHPISGNTCWGTVNVEDKNAPDATCPDNLTVLCVVDPDSVVHGVRQFVVNPATGQTIQNPEYPAADIFGNIVFFGDSALYTGHPTATDCSDILPIWTFNDDYTTFDCVDDPAKIADIVRTFVVEDEWGNYTTCTQEITWKRGEFGDVVWPDDIVIPCNYADLDAIIDADYIPEELEAHLNVIAWPYINGYNPDPNFGPDDSRLSLYDNGICGLGLTYTDEKVNLCANEWKIVRTWKLYDWCPETGAATQYEVVQNIKVENLAPVISFEECTVPGAVGCMDPVTGQFIMNASLPGNMPHYSCAAAYVPFAQIDAVCDQLVDVTVESPLGNTINGGALPSPGLPLGGPYQLVYRAEDKCGNITLDTIEVLVIDRTAPVAICDEITDVNLGANGLAEVFAETFDDGSWDGCAVQDFRVRRMSDNCGISGNTAFGPSVTFCCEDVANNPIMVEFQVRDYDNNTNTCMVEVYVQDKIPPILVSCPANQRISCDLYADNFETQLANAADEAEQCDILSDHFGSPVYQDNCPLNVACDINISLDQCLEGQIRRTFTATDDGGNVSQNCTQIINVDHVSDWVVEFPADQTVECGTTPPDFGEPEIFYETCELVAVSFEDEVFTTVPDACYKILRTWTVINWCVVGDEIDQEVVETPENQLGLIFPQCDLDLDGDCDARTFRDSWNASVKPNANDATKQTGPDTDLDSDPWDGYITYQQTIKVNDTVDPVFANGCDIPDVCIGDNTCDVDVTLPTPEIDECSFNVTFEVTGDLGFGFGPFLDVAPGTYAVRYVAMDNCNNQTACETTVTVVDCKLPTPYCKNGIIVELMVPVFPNDIPMVEVWASDLDAASFDNCPGDLTFSFSEDVNDQNLTLTCADLNGNTSADVPVTIYVTDASGNQDFCETVINVQANQGQCDDDALVAMNGLISTEDQESVEEVDVQLSGTAQSSAMTDVDGMFNFNVPLGGDYTITPLKDDNPLNGVTTFDLVKITKHILAVDPLDSPYKMIAADANKSNSITTFDLVQIRKLILFIDTEFPNNTSWRFVDKDYVFPNTTNPWSDVFPEVINFNNVDQSTLGADFVAIKVGDVNGSAQTNFAAAGQDRNMVGSLVFDVDDRKLNAGEEYTVEFKAKDFEVLGYQFTLNFDKQALEFVDVLPAVATGENFGLTLLEEGAITTSWNDNDVKLANGEVVFSLTFRASKDVKLSDAFTANSRYTVAEAYKPNGELLDIELAFNGQTVAGAFELYQNTPNPFSSNTLVGFNLPEAATATLTITDVSGRVVKMIEGDFERGYNEIRLERQALPAAGILYYQLDTPTDSATKMMLLVD